MSPRVLYDLISEIFSLDGEELRDNMGPDDIVLWDSLGHLALVTRLEEEYDIRLDTADVLALESIAHIRNILRKHRVPSF